MIKSMTGFGRCEICNEDHKIIVEMKSVNHKYCDFSIRIPKKLNFFEMGIRNILKEYISRGKVDIFINYEDYTQNNVSVKYNYGIAQGYMSGLSKISEDFNLSLDIGAVTLSRYQDVFVLEEQPIDEGELLKNMEEAIRKAAEQFVETRKAEGETLKRDLLIKLDSLYNDVVFIEERSPMMLKEYQEKIMNKVHDLLGDVALDDTVLATELVIYADKICTDEEIVRLKSHIKNMRNSFLEEDSIGRKLDFITQEMNREANTILSKSNDLEISNRSIEMKTQIEKIREQIQNIE